jgi:exosortase
MYKKHKRKQRQLSARDTLTQPLEIPAGRKPPRQQEVHTEPASPLGWSFVLAALALAGVFVWGYWDVLTQLVGVWEIEPDYSHGFLIVPVALVMLWARRDTRPPLAGRLSWLGLVVTLAGLAIWLAGSLWYVDAVQGWSIPVWIAGAIWFIGGWRMLRWCLPAVLFLAFMFPLPFRAERLLSQPLQTVAARISSWMLQTAGQPAVREGNIIVVDDLRINVVGACSGMRIFMSILALAFAYTVLVKAPWWTKAALWLAVVPIALIVNAARIACTGMLDLYVLGQERHVLSDEISGYLMIVFAGLLFAGVLWYMGRLIVEVEDSTPSAAMFGDPAPRPA